MIYLFKRVTVSSSSIIIISAESPLDSSCYENENMLFFISLFKCSTAGQRTPLPSATYLDRGHAPATPIDISSFNRYVNLMTKTKINFYAGIRTRNLLLHKRGHYQLGYVLLNSDSKSNEHKTFCSKETYLLTSS